VIGATLVAPLFTGTSTSWAHNLTLVDINTAPGRPTAQCSAPTAIVNGTAGLQFVVEGAIDGTTGARVGLAAHIDCVVKTSYGSFGGASGDGVGPVAAAAGVSHTIPFDKLAGVRVCAYGSVFYQGGVTIPSPVSPGC
jgi:hypothetical protein